MAIPVTDIYLNINARPGDDAILPSKGEAGQGFMPLATLGDRSIYRFWFYDVDQGQSTGETVRLDGLSLALGGRVAPGNIASPYLVADDGFTEGGDGIGGWYYETELDFGNQAIVDAFGDSTSPMTLTVELQMSDGSSRVYTSQFPMEVRHQVITGTPTAAPGDPFALKSYVDAQVTAHNADEEAHGQTAVGRAVLTAATQAAGRDALGAVAATNGSASGLTMTGTTTIPDTLWSSGEGSGFARAQFTGSANLTLRGTQSDRTTATTGTLALLIPSTVGVELSMDGSAITTNRVLTVPDASGTIALTTGVTAVQSNLTDHITNPTGAHAASAISATPTGGLAGAGSTAQTQLSELGSRVYHLSSVLGTHGVADVEGATVFGDDYTTQIQAILDLASVTNPVTVVVDGRYSTTGLTVRGYTTIKGLPGCGFLLRDAANKPVISNFTLTPGGGSSGQRDRHIRIEGITLNGNSAGQVHSNAEEGWIVILRMMGVQDMSLVDVRLLNMRTFAAHFANFDHVVVKNLYIDKAGGSGSNRDGIKFHGGTNLFVDGVDARTDDDCLSLCPNDITSQVSPVIAFPVYGPFSGPGDLVGVRVRNVNTRGGFGIRMLSTDNILDDVVIDGITGDVKYQAVLIDNYSEAPRLAGPPSPGNFGNISISNVSVRRTEDGYKNSVVFIGSRVKTLALNNITRWSGELGMPVVSIVDAQVDQLTIDGLRIHEAIGGTAYDAVSVSGSCVLSLSISNSNFSRDAFLSTSGGRLIRLTNLAYVGSLRICNSTTKNVKNILAVESGRIGSLFSVGVRHESSQGFAAFENTSGANVPSTHITGFSGATLLAETSGTFGVKTGDAFTSPQVIGDAGPYHVSEWDAVSGTNLTAYTPEIGGVWTVPNGSFEITDGLYGKRVINTGTATANFWRAVTDIGAGDNLVISGDFTITQSNNQTAIVIIRYSDESNYDFVSMSKTFGIEVYRNVAGTITRMGTVYEPGSWEGNFQVVPSVFSYRIILSGVNVMVFVQNFPPMERTLTGTLASTKVGIGMNNYATTGFMEFGSFMVEREITP